MTAFGIETITDVAVVLAEPCGVGRHAQRRHADLG